jgi:GT2 family glycosyltransferase
VLGVSVIIVNFNGEPLLDDCLSSLSRQTYRDFEIVFVDNGSSDGSVKRTRHLMPKARLVQLGQNVGWARGNNLGIDAAQGQYLVVLNNDTQADENLLSEMVHAVESDPSVGMVAPKILNFFDRKTIDSVGGLIICRDGIAQGRGRGEFDRGQYDHLREALIPSGCAALYRRAMLDEIGCFDEDFFAYCEDSDLGLRALWAGWKTVSAPRAIVYHKYSATSGNYSPAKLFWVERNHFFVALKNFPAQMILTLPWWTLYRYGLMAIAVFGSRGKGNAARNGKAGILLRALLRGLAHALLQAPLKIRQRSKVRKLTHRRFATLLKEFRLPQRKMIFND